MSSRREMQKLEKSKVERLLREDEERNRKVFCVFCERPIGHAASGSRTIPLESMKVFSDSPVCYQCHQQLHRLHKNRQLAQHLNSIDAVKADEEFQKYLKWVKKLPPETIYT